jgi:hypothetical protein
LIIGRNYCCSAVSFAGGPGFYSVSVGSALCYVPYSIWAREGFREWASVRYGFVVCFLGLERVGSLLVGKIGSCVSKKVDGRGLVGKIGFCVSKKVDDKGPVCEIGFRMMRRYVAVIQDGLSIHVPTCSWSVWEAASRDGVQRCQICRARKKKTKWRKRNFCFHCLDEHLESVHRGMTLTMYFRACLADNEGNGELVVHAE